MKRSRLTSLKEEIEQLTIKQKEIKALLKSKKEALNRYEKGANERRFQLFMNSSVDKNTKIQDLVCLSVKAGNVISQVYPKVEDLAVIWYDDLARLVGCTPLDVRILQALQSRNIITYAKEPRLRY